MKYKIVYLVSMLLFIMIPSFAEEYTTETLGIDERVENILISMSDYLGAKPNFKFEVIDSIDNIDEDGVRIQYSSKREVQLSRPDRLKSFVKGDSVIKHTVFNQGHIKIILPDQNTYLEKKDLPKNIEDTLNLLANKEGLTIPLADFFRETIVDDELFDNIIFAVYAGESVVDPEDCHHLAINHESIDWQIWIQKGDKPLPRKLIITYNEIEGNPQYTAYFENWEFPDSFPDDTFQMEIPEKAERAIFSSEILESIMEAKK
jgi:hypothetical protein